RATPRPLGSPRDCRISASLDTPGFSVARRSIFGGTPMVAHAATSRTDKIPRAGPGRARQSCRTRPRLSPSSCELRIIRIPEISIEDSVGEEHEQYVLLRFHHDCLTTTFGLSGLEAFVEPDLGNCVVRGQDGTSRPRGRPEYAEDVFTGRF